MTEKERKPHSGTHATTATLEGASMNVEDAPLRPWQEVVGTLDGVETYAGRVVLRISLIRRIGLEIPHNELMESVGRLVQLKGRKISILRTDEDYILQSKPDDDTRSTVPRRRD